MVDRVQPRKMESPTTGGTQLDQFDTDLNPNEDFVDARGLTIQNDSSNDEDVRLSRDGSGNMTFLDEHNSLLTLTDLLGGAAVKTQEVLFSGVLSVVVDHSRGQMPLVQVLVNVTSGWGANGWGGIPWGFSLNGYERLPDDQYVTSHVSPDKFIVQFPSTKTGKVLYF